MDVFNFRNGIVEDYRGYVWSFIAISQPRLRDFVERCFRSGSLWPDPLIQLNPTFKPGKIVMISLRKGCLIQIAYPFFAGKKRPRLEMAPKL